MTELEEKKVVIFGAGSGGQKVAKVLDEKFAYFVDNDVKKIGTTCRGKMVYSPDKLLSEVKEELLIFVYSDYANEIIEQLKKLGFQENVHYQKTTPQFIVHSQMKKHFKNLFFQYKERLTDNSYQPLKLDGVLIDDSKREWKTRWELIKKELLSYNTSSIIDIGCAEGWFVRQAAQELNCFAIGVEMEDNRLTLGELSRLHDGVENCAIMKAKLSKDNVLRLPAADIVLCLNVVHHIIYSEGYNAGVEFLSALLKIVNKALIFEMGTSTEKNLKWHKDMPEMPEGQEAFIRELLTISGFKNIRLLGSTPSLSEKYHRLLFVAEPVTNSRI